MTYCCLKCCKIANLTVYSDESQCVCVCVWPTQGIQAHVHACYWSTASKCISSPLYDRTTIRGAGSTRGGGHFLLALMMLSNAYTHKNTYTCESPLINSSPYIYHQINFSILCRCVHSALFGAPSNMTMVLSVILCDPPRLLFQIVHTPI